MLDSKMSPVTTNPGSQTRYPDCQIACDIKKTQKNPKDLSTNQKQDLPHRSLSLELKENPYWMLVKIGPLSSS